MHSYETGSLPTDQSVGTRISAFVTGKRKCVVTALYFVSVFSMSHWQAELAQLHPTTCPLP